MAETVLVTGGAGFIGSFLTDALVRRGDHVIVYDSLSSQVHPSGLRPSHLNRAAEFVKADILDREQLQSAVMRSDVIFHEAAAVGVGQSMYQIQGYVDTNIGGTALLLELLVKSQHHVRKLVVPGSMSAYGEGRYRCPICGAVSPTQRSAEQLMNSVWELICAVCGSPLIPQPTDEDKLLQPSSVYAVTKKTQEELVLTVGRAFGIPTTVLRYFNVYGPRQSLDNPYTGVAAIFMSRLKNRHSPLVFEDGMQTRDFISVHDVVAANLAVMHDSRSDYVSFNVGTGSQTNIVGLAETLGRLLNADISPTIVGKFRKGDIRHCWADISLMKRTVGWAPRVSLDAGLQELIDWSEGVSAADRVDTATEELRRHGLLVG